MKKKTILATILVSVLTCSNLFATEGAVLYKKCAGCHGIKGEKKALGKSEVISNCLLYICSRKLQLHVLHT